MNKIYTIFTVFLIIIPLVIIFNSIFSDNEQFKIIINSCLLLLIVIMAIIALLIRFISDKKEHKNN